MPKPNLNDTQRKLDIFRAQSSLTTVDKLWIACIEQAIQSGIEGNYSVGSVIVDDNQTIVGRGRNSVFTPTFRSDAHAEMNAINQLEASLPHSNKAKFTLFSTLEPCLMCTARILFSSICEVVFLYPDANDGMHSRLHLLPSNYQELGSRIRFVKYQESPELIAIAKDLYEMGEQIWNHQYKL